LEQHPADAGTQHLQLGDVYGQKEMFREAVNEYTIGFADLGFKSDKVAALKTSFAKSGINGFYRELLAQLSADLPAELNPVVIAELYARLGDKDKAFECLEKASAVHSDGLLHIKENYGFDILLSDPRYAEILRSS
jgi:tetratricopeptide (TPR) repeat protein